MPDFERLLRAMEDRLTARMDANSKAVNEAVRIAQHTSGALDALEGKVDRNEVRMKEMIEESEQRIKRTVEVNEERVLDVVKGRLKGMVDEQLREAGFDPDLTAGMMTPASKVQARAENVSRTYASVTTAPRGIVLDVTDKLTQQDRREERFWECRRSLRLWPVSGTDKKDLDDFLVGKLRMDRSFVENDIGPVKIRKN